MAAPSTSLAATEDRQLQAEAAVEGGAMKELYSPEASFRSTASDPAPATRSSVLMPPPAEDADAVTAPHGTEHLAVLGNSQDLGSEEAAPAPAEHRVAFQRKKRIL